MEQLGGLDAAFLYFETPTMHMHVLGIMIVDPSTIPDGTYSFARLRRFIEDRVGLVPGMRRKLAEVPFSLSRPYWVEDADFDLDYHVRRIAVPAPGGAEEVADLAADIAGRPLDRSKPLWEMWVVEGLSSGEVAIVTKVHHSTIDGVTGANMMAELFDLDPVPAPRAIPDDTWEPERRPGELELLARGAYDVTVRPFGVARLIPGTLLSVGRLLLERRRRPTPGMPAPFTAPRTSFNATVTPHRKVAYTKVALEDVKTVKNAFGVKVNDVVVAVVSGALRRYLDARDELPTKSLIAAVPVSVHDQTEDKAGITRVSVMFSSLASDVADPAERLRTVAQINEGAKADHELVGARMLQDWAEHAAPNTFSLAARMYSSLRIAERHPVVHNLIVSNVPGPPIPLYFDGMRLTGLYPLGPIMDGAGLNITVLSQEDQIGFGLIACRELVPRLWDLADAIPEALDELVRAAAAQAGTGAKAPARRRTTASDAATS